MPLTTAAHVAVCVVLIDDGLAATAIPVTVTGVATAVMLIEAELDFVVSCVDVAMQLPMPVLDGVNTPLCVMLPPVAVQVTAVL